MPRWNALEILGGSCGWRIDAPGGSGPDRNTNNLLSLENLALRRRPLCGIAATLSQKPTAFRLI